jgi:cell wall-associated NlpC family hydrolase
MSKFVKYLSFLIAVALIMSACQPSVRFARNDNKAPSKESKKSTKEKPTEINSDSKMDSDIQQDLDATSLSILKEAEKWIGTPYCHGGETSDCIDCSGFTMNVFGKIGINLPRTAAEQYDFSVKIDKKTCRAGDLVFFGERNHISHVGIYTGKGEFIHSSSSKGVMRQSLSDPYYQKKLVGFGKVNKNS